MGRKEKSSCLLVVGTETDLERARKNFLGDGNILDLDSSLGYLMNLAKVV